MITETPISRNSAVSEMGSIYRSAWKEGIGVDLLVAASVASSVFSQQLQFLLSLYTCPFKLLTGLPCPGCGSTQAWIGFFQGDYGEIQQNPFSLILCSGLLVVLLWRYLALITPNMTRPEYGVFFQMPAIKLFFAAWMGWASWRVLQVM